MNKKKVFTDLVTFKEENQVLTILFNIKQFFINENSDFFFMLK